MNEREWKRDRFDHDPRHDNVAPESPGGDGSLAPTMEGRLRQLELILGELLGGGGDDRFRVTVWEKNPTSHVRNPRLDSVVITDDWAIERGRLN